MQVMISGVAQLGFLQQSLKSRHLSDIINRIAMK